ncbi:hypothetical protein EV715DRAFT_188071, partial [Schizophyllum commune]
DNATIHQKRADKALSARCMPKGPSPFPAPGDEDKNFGVKKAVTDSKGNALYVLKTVKRRRKKGEPKNLDTSYSKTLPDGKSIQITQLLYLPVDPGHPDLPGRFKGMSSLLSERGFEAEAGLPAECHNFQCNPLLPCCFCHRFLYNQPDFLEERSKLEDVCSARGFRILFLPKFHCELNFIEQVWGAAKRAYRTFARRAWKFIDAYRKGSDGRVAAWAAKRSHGHRTLPENILQ